MAGLYLLGETWPPLVARMTPAVTPAIPPATATTMRVVVNAEVPAMVAASTLAMGIVPVVVDPWDDTTTLILKEPAILFACNPGALACPSAPVVVVKLDWPPGKLAPGPLLGRRKVTVAPLTGLWFSS